MKLVLLFFCIVLIIIILLLFSSVRLNVKKCYISNIENNKKRSKIDTDILVYLEVYLLGIIKIAKVKITKKRIEKLKIKPDLSDLKRDVGFAKKFHLVKLIKKLKIRVKNAYLEAFLGTDSVMFTVYSVAFFSTILGILFRNAKEDKSEFKILPIYNFGNAVKFNLKCIIDVKIVHIIYVIVYTIKKAKNQHAVYD